MEGLNSNRKNKEISPEERIRFEKLLWRKAEDLSEDRRVLQEKINEFDAIFYAKPLSILNLHEERERQKEEQKYWEIKDEILGIIETENIIQKMLSDLEEDLIDIEELNRFLPKKDGEDNKLSKRKQQIRKEKERIGEDLRNILGDLNEGHTLNATRLTTGKHATGITGSFDPLTAEGAFFDATADTHGGKVRKHGKNGFYKNSSGRVVRKK